MRFQIETATAVCFDAASLRAELVRLRQMTAAAARNVGCALVAAGTSPYGTPGLGALTDRPRYHELARRYPALTAASGTCGCHVHVGIPSRDLGVRVLARLRPWLSPLLALSVNSPLHNGRDTGWVSHRYSLVTRWPTAEPPGVWPNATAYDQVVRRMISRGAVLDESSVYLLARLSPRFPTIEVRVADVCPDVDTALLVALLVRALVVTSVADVRAGRAAPPAPGKWVRAGLVRAARNGPAGSGIDPATGCTTEPGTLVDRMLEHVDGALGALGDRSLVTALLASARARGSGADRQLAVWRRSPDPAETVAALAAMTVSHISVDVRPSPSGGRPARAGIRPGTAQSAGQRAVA